MHGRERGLHLGKAGGFVSGQDGALHQSSYQRNYHPMNQHGSKVCIDLQDGKVTCEVTVSTALLTVF